MGEPGVGDWAQRVAAFFEENGRTRVLEVLRNEMARTPSSKPTLVVAGEDKRGKSSLVNALLRRPGLSPVGVEVVTGAPVTFFFSKQEKGFVLHYGESQRTEVPVEEARSLATVQGNPGNEHNVRGVSLGIDSPLLENLLVVDSPGVGGLESGHAQLTLNRLREADALLFVLEAAAQIRNEELKFLQKAANRIHTVVIALTKVDNWRGWQQVLADNRTILAEKAPRFAEVPIIPVSALIAQRSLKLGEAGAPLWKESGFEELERVILERVAGHVVQLHDENVVQAGLSPLATIEREAAERLHALGSPAQAEQALVAERARLGELNRDRAEWPQTLQTELRRLGIDRNEQLSRGILELRNRYDERLKDNKLSDHETLPGELVADLTALAASVNEWTEDRLLELIQQIVQDLDAVAMIAGSLREISDAAFSEELAAMTLGQHTLTTMDKISVVQSYSSGHSLASLLASGGASLALFSGPIALAAGVVLGGAMAFTKFRHSKQAAFSAEFRSWMNDEIQRLQLTMGNSFQRAQIDLEVGIRDTMRTAFTEREREINEAIQACQQASQQQASQREGARRHNEAMLSTVRELRREGLELLATLRA
jgi:hypothetical protein